MCMRSNIVSKLELLWEPETRQSNVAAQPRRPPPRPVLPTRQGGAIRADFGIYGAAGSFMDSSMDDRMDGSVDG